MSDLDRITSNAEAGSVEAFKRLIREYERHNEMGISEYIKLMKMAMKNEDREIAKVMLPTALRFAEFDDIALLTHMAYGPILEFHKTFDGEEWVENPQVMEIYQALSSMHELPEWEMDLLLAGLLVNQDLAAFSDKTTSFSYAFDIPSRMPKPFRSEDIQENVYLVEFEENIISEYGDVNWGLGYLYEHDGEPYFILIPKREPNGNLIENFETAKVPVYTTRLPDDIWSEYDWLDRQAIPEDPRGSSKDPEDRADALWQLIEDGTMTGYDLLHGHDIMYTIPGWALRVTYRF